MSLDGTRRWSHEQQEGPETIEEELELIAEAMRLGIDPFPPKRERNRVMRLALGWFMIVIMISWVS